MTGSEEIHLKRIDIAWRLAQASVQTDPRYTRDAGTPVTESLKESLKREFDRAYEELESTFSPSGHGITKMKREYEVLQFLQPELLDPDNVKKELNGYAEKGYRVVSSASVTSGQSTSPAYQQRLLVILERDASLT